MLSNSNSQGASPPSGGAAAPAALTPELVRQVADLVYAQLLREMQIERERARLNRGGSAYDRR